MRGPSWRTWPLPKKNTLALYFSGTSEPEISIVLFLLGNIYSRKGKQRQKEFEKEEKALDNSEKEFKQAKQYLEHVENKAKKKEVEQLDSAIKEKYKSHDAYAKAYKKALNKEKELFSYLNEDNATQSEVDGKSKDLSKAYKEMNNKFNAYSKAIEKVKREKQDVDQLK